MHGHLIRWLSEIIKINRKRSATYMLAPRRGYLGYSKVYCDSEKDGSWHETKTDILLITYPYSVN